MAESTVGELSVKIHADTTDLKSGITDAKKQVDDFSSTALKSAKALGTFGLAATAAAGVISAYAASTAKAMRQTEMLANVAGTSTKNFQQLSFAFKTLGIDQKGVADAMNDVRERIGEFVATGGSGVFQDFADVMKYTETQAMAMARTLNQMSGEEAIREMARQMEEAGASSNEMMFVMKSMSNDLGYATELFANQGAELDRLKGQYGTLQEQLGLTAAQTKGLDDVAESIDLVGEAFELAGTQLIANFSGPFVSTFKWIAENVPIATNAVIDFVNSFRDPEQIESLRSVNALIVDQKEEVERLREKHANLNDQQKRRAGGALKRAEAELAQLEAQRAKLEEIEKQLEKVNAKKLGDLSAVDAGGLRGGGKTPAQIAREKELEEERIFQEQLQQIVDDAHVWYMEQQGAQHLEKMELKKAQEEEYMSLVQEGNHNHRLKMKAARDKDLDDEEAKWRATVSGTQSMFGDLATIQDTGSKKLFKIGKAMAISEAVVSTYAAANKQFEALSHNPPLAYAAAAAAVVAGMVRVRAIAARQFSDSAGGASGGAGGVPSVAGNAGQVRGGEVNSSNTTYVRGINPGDLYTGEQMVDMINEAQENGSRLVFL